MTRRVLLTGVILLLGIGMAGATTLVKMGFSDLAREAKHIVVGTVTGIDGEYDPSGTFIRSNVTLEVERSFRGHAPDTIVLRTPGGQVGGMGQVALGVANFEVGERVLVFLTTWEEDGAPKVLGYVQGKSRVGTDGRLHGGIAGGRGLENVARELRHGARHNIPLQPAN